jgi:hypothetical protein
MSESHRNESVLSAESSSELLRAVPAPASAPAEPIALAPSQARFQARQLRASGLDYQTIADRIGCALSTAWRWTHAMRVETADENDRRRGARPARPLTAEHRERLAASLRAAWIRRRR